MTTSRKLSGDGHRLTLTITHALLMDNSGETVRVDRSRPIQVGPDSQCLVPVDDGLHTSVWPEHVVYLASVLRMEVLDSEGHRYRVTQVS